MTGSDTSEQRAFLEQENFSKRPLLGRADLLESEAIRRAQRADAEAFDRIYQVHCRPVYALCLRVMGNSAEAEDLTQEAFLTVLCKIRTFRGESAFSTWLHRIAVNLALMRLRKKTIHQVTDEPDGASRDKLGGSDLRLAASIDRVHLERAIEQLAPRHKVVFELHDIQGYKHKEIAQIMYWSIGNSKAQLHRARIRLRELLQEGIRLMWATPVRATQATLEGR